MIKHPAFLYVHHQSIIFIMVHANDFGRQNGPCEVTRKNLQEQEIGKGIPVIYVLVFTKLHWELEDHV